MASTGRFDRWENASGVAYGTVLQVQCSGSIKPQVWATSSSSNYNYVGGNEENRGRVYWCPEGFEISIKPRSSDSKFLIMGHCSTTTSTDNSYNTHWRITRNGQMVGQGDHTGQNYTWNAHGQVRTHSGAGYAGSFHPIWNFYDTPYTTELLIYRFEILQTYPSNYRIYINRENDMGWESPSSSHFTVMEIQA